MAEQKPKISHEEFKQQVLQWKNNHRDEYTHFVSVMNEMPEEMLFPLIAKFMKKGGKLRKEWERRCNDDSEDNFDGFTAEFAASSLPETLVKEFYAEAPIEQVSPTSEMRKSSRIWIAIKNKLLMRKPVPKVSLSVPLILAWLYYGKSFERMVDYMNANIGYKKLNNAERATMSLVMKQAVNVSIKNGFRTQEDWNRYFANQKAIKDGKADEWIIETMNAEAAAEQKEQQEVSELVKAKEQIATMEQEKRAIADEAKSKDATIQELRQQNERAQIENSKLEMSLSKVQCQVEAAMQNTPKPSGRPKSKDQLLEDYLNCDCKSEVIDVIRKYAIANNTGDKLALPFYALSKLDLFNTVPTATEYSTAFSRQFSDIEGLRSESAYRQSVGKLNKAQTIYIKGKQTEGTLLEDDMYAPVLAKLIKDIEKVLKKHA